MSDYEHRLGLSCSEMEDEVDDWTNVAVAANETMRRLAEALTDARDKYHTPQPLRSCGCSWCVALLAYEPSDR